MPIARVQAEFSVTSGLPKDKIVNVWHFEVSDYGSTAMEVLAERIRDFYVLDEAGSQAAPLYTYMSTWVVSAGHHVKVYDVGATPGSPPIVDEAFDFVSDVRTDSTYRGLPEEVACCLSFRNEGSLAVNPKHRRGRIYFGPLNIKALDAFTVGERSNPGTTFLTDMASAGLILKSKDDLDGELVVYSPTMATGFGVDRFWVDNAFDTQKRRGPEATARTYFPPIS